MKERFYSVKVIYFEDVEVFAVVDTEDNSIEWYTGTQLNTLKPVVQQKGYNIVQLDYEKVTKNFKKYPMILRYFYAITSDFMQSGCFEYDNFIVYFRSFLNSLESLYNLYKTYAIPRDLEGISLKFMTFYIETQGVEPNQEIDFEYRFENMTKAEALRGFKLEVYDSDEFLTNICYGNTGVKKSTVRGMCDDFKKWFITLSDGYDCSKSGVFYETMPPTDALVFDNIVAQRYDAQIL